MATRQAKKKKKKRARKSRADLLAEREVAELGEPEDFPDTGDHPRLTRAQVAYALGIAPIKLQETYRPFIPEELIDTTCRPHRYDLRVFGAIVHQSDGSDKKSVAAQKQQIDLEKSRFELDKARKKYLKKEVVVEALDRFVATLRRYGENMRATGDNKVVALWNEMLDEAASAARQATEKLDRDSQEEDKSWAA